MRPLFTIHAGEYLVASEIERRFPQTRVWVPSRDDGVDLLVTDGRNRRRPLSLQVKFSKDFLPQMGQRRNLKNRIRACGWWTIDQEKLAKSLADYWVFVLVGFFKGTRDFIVVRPRELAKRLTSLRRRGKKANIYFWVARGKRCWETRDMPKTDQLRLADGRKVDRRRDFTAQLNNWAPVRRLNRG